MVPSFRRGRRRPSGPVLRILFLEIQRPSTHLRWSVSSAWLCKCCLRYAGMVRALVGCTWLVRCLAVEVQLFSCGGGSFVEFILVGPFRLFISFSCFALAVS